MGVKFGVIDTDDDPSGRSVSCSYCLARVIIRITSSSSQLEPPNFVSQVQTDRQRSSAMASQV